VKKLKDGANRGPAQLAKAFLIESRKILPSHEDFSSIDAVDTPDAIEQSALPRARWPHQCGAFSGLKRQRNSPEHRIFTVGFCDLGNLQGFHFTSR
jgi:hypothetical protein